MQPASPPRQVSSPFANAPPFSSFDSQEVSAVEGDHDAGWSFHEVPLNDKPAQMADSVDQNGEHAQQQAAAESRKANPAMPPDDQVSQQAADLLKENALLHRRLQHVEGVSTAVLAHRLPAMSVQHVPFSRDTTLKGDGAKRSDACLW